MIIAASVPDKYQAFLISSLAADKWHYSPTDQH